MFIGMYTIIPRGGNVGSEPVWGIVCGDEDSGMGLDCVLWHSGPREVTGGPAAVADVGRRPSPASSRQPQKDTS